MGTMGAAHQRFAALLDSTSLDMNTEIGDGHRGAAETFGKIIFERSADDYFNSDLILCWGANPVATQIPNAHFLLEARDHGAELWTIAPDYSPSAMHADRWIPVKPGGDAALALGAAHVLVEEGLVDRAFVAEQTDLPLLVREDTRLYLRESGVVAAPYRSLALEGLEPSLEGRFEATLHDGKKVGVRTVFSLLRERLAGYTPEQASKLSGTPASLIHDLARRMARAKAAAMVTTRNFSKYYHGNLIERSQALLFALAGWTDERISYERSRQGFSRGFGLSTSGAMFWYAHAGLVEASEQLRDWDPYLKRPIGRCSSSRSTTSGSTSGPSRGTTRA